MKTSWTFESLFLSRKNHTTRAVRQKIFPASDSFTFRAKNFLQLHHLPVKVFTIVNKCLFFSFSSLSHAISLQSSRRGKKTIPLNWYRCESPDGGKAEIVAWWKAKKNKQGLASSRKNEQAVKDFNERLHSSQKTALNLAEKNRRKKLNVAAIEVPCAQDVHLSCITSLDDF